MLTLVPCRYLPFVVCGFLKLVEVVALRLWRLGLNTGRFVRSRAVMHRNVEMEPPNENINNDLL